MTELITDGNVLKENLQQAGLDTSGNLYASLKFEQDHEESGQYGIE